MGSLGWCVLFAVVAVLIIGWAALADPHRRGGPWTPTHETVGRLRLIAALMLLGAALIGATTLR